VILGEVDEGQHTGHDLLVVTLLELRLRKQVNKGEEERIKESEGAIRTQQRATRQHSEWIN